MAARGAAVSPAALGPEETGLARRPPTAPPWRGGGVPRWRGGARAPAAGAAGRRRPAAAEGAAVALCVSAAALRRAARRAPRGRRAAIAATAAPAAPPGAAEAAPARPEAALDALPPPGERKFRIQHVGSKGQGAVATSRISLGELLLQESPLLAFQGEADDVLFGYAERPADDPLANSKVFYEYERSLRAAVEGAGPDKEEAFWDLSDFSVEKGTGHKTAVGIVRTNALENGQYGAALCLATSRFNHSCTPNVHSFWCEEQGAQTLRATRDVEQGDELCISYLTPSLLCNPLFMRQGALTEQFGFRCTCEVCTMPHRSQALSDQKRRKLGRLWDALLEAERLEELGENVVDETVGLVDAELGGSPAMKALVYFSGFRLAVASGALGRAAPLAARARDSTVLAEGRGSLYAAALNGYAKDPASFLKDRDKWVMPP